MREWAIAVLLVLSGALFTSAQDSDEYHKIEVSAGYSNLLADGFLGDGELYADGEDERLESTQDVAGIYGSPDLVANPNNLFPTTPLVYSGRRQRPRLDGFNASVVFNFSKYFGVKFEVSGHHRTTTANLPVITTTAPFRNITLAECASRLGSVPANVASCGELLPRAASYPGPFTVRSVVILPDVVTEARQRHYNFLGGVQLKNNSKEKRFKPFAHVMAGVSRQTVEFEGFAQRELSTFGGNKFTNTGLTMAFGGGVDIRLGKRIDLRVIQVDYNPVKIKGREVIAFQQPITNLGIPNNLTFTNLTSSAVYSNNDVRIGGRWQNNFRIGVGIVFH